MPSTSTNLLKAALRVMNYARVDEIAGPFTGDVGVIFMLHHVVPESASETGKTFDPNGILRVRPDFLESVVDFVVASGFDVIALDEVPSRLVNRKHGDRPFACFTFDDGYRDNRDYAYPIFKSRGLPFAVYVPSAFADGTGELWWLGLEGAIKSARTVSVQMEGQLKTFQTETVDEKYTAYNEIYWWLRDIPEDRARAVVGDLCATVGFDTNRLCRDLVMSWDELRDFAADPLVTIGAHTKGHYSVAKLPYERALDEMRESILDIEQQLERPCRHFSYPYGSPSDAGSREFEMLRELGVETGVTTRKGLLQAGHSGELMALPRLSLNGDFQDIELVKTLLSGVPFALLNAVKTVAGRRAAG